MALKKLIPVLAAVVMLLAVFVFVYFNWEVFDSSSLPSNSAALSWEPSQEKGIKGYRIYYGTESGKWTSEKDVGLTETPTKPKVVIKDLKRGVRYYFAIKAYNAAGIESEYSDIVQKDIPR